MLGKSLEVSSVQKSGLTLSSKLLLKRKVRYTHVSTRRSDDSITDLRQAFQQGSSRESASCMRRAVALGFGKARHDMDGTKRGARHGIASVSGERGGGNLPEKVWLPCLTSLDPVRAALFAHCLRHNLGSY
jgi:hypothetical protein